MPQGGVPMTYPFPYKTLDGDTAIATEDPLILNDIEVKNLTLTKFLKVTDDAEIDGTLTLNGDLETSGNVTAKKFIATDPVDQYTTTASDLDFVINDSAPTVTFKNNAAQPNVSIVAGKYFGTNAEFVGSSSTFLNVYQKNTNTNPNAKTGFLAENAAADTLELVVDNNRTGRIRNATDAGLEIETVGNKKIKLLANNITEMELGNQETFVPKTIKVGSTVGPVDVGLVDIVGDLFATKSVNAMTGNFEKVSVTGVDDESIITLGGIKATGNVNCDKLKAHSTQDATNLNNGSIHTQGGASIAKTLRAGKIENTPIGVLQPATISFTSGSGQDTTDATSRTSAAFTLQGGLGVAKHIRALGLEDTPVGQSVASTLRFTTGTGISDTDATSVTAAAFTLAGGLGVTKTIRAGGIENTSIGTNEPSNLKCTTAVATSTTDATNNTSGAVTIAGGLGVAKTVFAQSIQDTPLGSIIPNSVKGTTGEFTSTASSLSTNTGALIVAGGAGIGGTVNCEVIKATAGTITGLDTTTLDAEVITTESLTSTGAVSGNVVNSTTAVNSATVNTGVLNAVTAVNVGLVGNTWTPIVLGCTSILTGAIGAGAVTTTSLATGNVTAAAGSFSGGLTGSIGGGTANSGRFTTIESTNTDDATDKNTGPVKFAGGLAVDKTVYAGSIENTPIGTLSPAPGRFTTMTTTTAAGSDVNFASIGAIDPGTAVFTKLSNNDAVGSTANFESVGALTPGSGSFTTIANSTAAGSALNAASIGATTPGTATFTVLQNNTAAGSFLNAETIGETAPGSGKFTTINNSVGPGSALTLDTVTSANVIATTLTSDTASFTTCTSGRFTSNNGIFRTSAGSNDYTLVGSQSADNINNTQINVNGPTRATNPGCIEYKSADGGSHLFYGTSGGTQSTANSLVVAGTSQANLFTTNSEFFKTATGPTDVAFWGTNATAGVTNTNIILNGHTSATNPGRIEYTATGGPHQFFGVLGGIRSLGAGILETGDYRGSHFTTLNGTFKTSRGATDYTLLGSQMDDIPVENTQIAINGRTRATNPGSIEYHTAIGGNHLFYGSSGLMHTIDLSRTICGVSQANVFTTNNDLFRTATSDTDVSRLGTLATDGNNNTQILLSAVNRAVKPGTIEYKCSGAGRHEFYNQGSFGTVHAGNFTTNAVDFMTYSRGTWIPEMVNGNNNTTSLTYIQRIANWTKIGNQVTVSCQMIFDFTVPFLQTFAYRIAGFPFAVQDRLTMPAYAINLSGAPNNIYLYFDAGTSFCIVFGPNNNALSGGSQNGNEIRFTITYMSTVL